MDTNNWRPTQGASSAIGGTIGDPTMESGDWRAQLQPDSRQRIVNKIMDTLKRHLPFSGHEGLQELKRIAVRFEEKIYTAATSQSDYLRKISLKMLTMETRSQNPMSDPMQSNSNANSGNPPDPGSQVMSQVNNQGQLSNPVQSNNIQQGQQMMSQSMHNNNLGSTGMQGSSSLSSALPPGSGLQQPILTNTAGQSANLQNIQNMSSVQQNNVGNTMGNSNFANQRQIQGRQQLVNQQQPQQQLQNQNSHYLYQQQLQQIAKQKLQQPSLQPHIQQQQHQQQQQQQHNMLQPNHLQPSSQQSVMQPAMMQSSSLSTVVQNQQPVVPQSSQPLMNHQQSVLRQQRQQQAQPIQQQTQPTLQNPMGQQTNATNMQQNQLIGQQNNYSDIQQQQQRLIGQQNKLSSLQQPQQQLIGQHNNLSSMQQQSGQQQQLLGNQAGNSNLQNNQHSVQQILQSNKMPIQQQNQQNSVNLLPTQVQQSQPQLQQPVMPHMQAQSNQLQQQVGMQQQPNLLQRDMQQRLPTTGGFQQQNVIDQQKQIFQQQRAMPEASSTSLDSTAQTGNPNGGDWQEEVYQKIKAMKDLYLLDLSDMHQKILSKLQQHDALPQPPKNDQFDKLKVFKNMLERFMQFLQIPKHGILANYKDKLSSYEKQIIHVINSNRRKPTPPQQQAQALPPPHMQSMQQSQQTHSQLTQVQSHDQMNLQGSMAPMQSNNMGNMQQNTVSLSGGSNPQQNMMNTIQSNSNLDPVQNGNMNSLQQVNNSSLQQNSVSGPQQVNINPMSLQANSNMLQHQHIKQQEQLLQTQQMKQIQQRQMQQQYLHKQQLLQQQQQQHQFHQQTKQQLSGNQLSQLPQISDGGDIKLRQQMNVKPGGGFQHVAAAAAQRSAYHQHLKPGAPFSPQLLSAASPQMSQHTSPQIDQSNMFKSASSPFTVPSPSTSSASPLPGDFERINGVPSLSNVGNIGHQQQPSSSVLPNQIGTPGISASPLLAEFTSTDGNHGVVPSMGPGKSTVTEQPIERLLKAVKSISPAALSASVSDIGSVVSMIDRIAGSAPGNGSRAAVGEDLVAMTKCRLQARNFVTQDGTNGVRKMKRFTSAMPLNVVSSTGSVNDSFKQLNVSETSELDSTASSAMKRPRTETNHALLEEIKEINRGLIDTVVAVSDEDVDPAAATAASEGGDGTVVKCSFSAVALGPNLKSQYASAQMSPIQPLRLLVPANYPNCSPMLLDKFPAEVSKEFEDLSTKTKSRFSISLRSLSQPMSLKEIARTWDVCARAVIAEYAQQTGGGTFSSKYGTWENCLSAAW